jgi:ribose 5-phosphate isomerase B
MKIILGADHGGFELKEEIKKYLEVRKMKVTDVGAEKLDSDDDFVDYAEFVSSEVSEGDSMGILFCRNGFGMMIAANRIPGVRCGFGIDEKMVKAGRNDDDINCLAIPADYLKTDEVKKVIDTFLNTKFSGEERFKRRLYKLEMLGGSCCGGGCGNC